MGGIAILKNPAKSQIDANGDYIEEKSPLYFFENLYSLEDNEEKQREIYGYSRSLIYPAMRYLYAFNALMEIIEEVYDIADLADTTRLDTSLFESKMTAYNNMLYVFYHNVYGNEAEKQHKRAIIKEVFSPLEIDTLTPTKEAIEGVKAELTKLGFSSNARKRLKYLDAFIDRLMYSREGA
jgi:hypothetical protein